MNQQLTELAKEALLCSQTEIGLRWLTSTPLKLEKFAELILQANKQDTEDAKRFKYLVENAGFAHRLFDRCETKSELFSEIDLAMDKE